jgi:hypothetical protein
VTEAWVVGGEDLVFLSHLVYDRLPDSAPERTVQEKHGKPAARMEVAYPTAIQLLRESVDLGPPSPSYQYACSVGRVRISFTLTRSGRVTQ